MTKLDGPISDKQSKWYSNRFEVDSVLLEIRDSQHISKIQSKTVLRTGR